MIAPLLPSLPPSLVLSRFTIGHANFTWLRREASERCRRRIRRQRRSNLTFLLLMISDEDDKRSYRLAILHNLDQQLSLDWHEIL